MTAEIEEESGNDTGPAGMLTGRRRLYALAAAGAVLAIGAAALFGFLGRETGPVIASAGIVQGDVRIQSAGGGNWRQIGSIAAPLVAGTSLRATSSGRIALDLPAQGSLRLDASTQVTLTGEREIELASGSIYVDTGTDAASPAIAITTEVGAIQAIGAQVAVVLIPDALYVSVRSGDVELVRDADAIPVAASAGEGIQLLTGDSPRRMDIRTYGSDWTWVETLSSAPDVQGQTLASFLDWFRYETGRPLRFDDSTTEARAATTTLDVDIEGLDAMRALEIVLSTTELEHSSRYDGSIRISPRS
jgi:ferric-dicitrate binding protein FerR (iron transport regulator)